MKHLWMLFDKRDGKLVSWTVFPTRKAANAYKTLGQNLWLQTPYCGEGHESTPIYHPSTTCSTANWRIVTGKVVKKGRSTGTLTKEEEKLHRAIRDLGCICCWMVGIGPVPCAIHHLDRKSTRLNSSHRSLSRMPSSA